MTSKTQVQLDIVSDVVCPWCIVGYKRLQTAISELSDVAEFSINWQPFELNPQMPAGGQHLGEHIQEKYGSSPEQSQQSRQQLQNIGSDIGFEFNFNDESRIYNTFNAHKLLLWAKDFDKQTALKLALFDSYFTAQQNIENDEVLLAAVEVAGLSAAEAGEVLANDELNTFVRAELNRWTQAGISSVPSVIVDSKYLINGARESSDVKALLLQIIDEQTTA
ncbi:DsbA family oxidoreductase [Alginatibacterium sediminis]|uniref:DsbA family oxidoreductase n=1 Tax=Alginatibacterium sediminis TaxID=2164068 RepID=A0A420ELE9_9ALTE|nr:DsbA family oxidoreductase [Alginatibacterium sediminis]RKF21542.1 DsbA family oxidoreductase [Alginatibacterium sediminis]